MIVDHACPLACLASEDADDPTTGRGLDFIQLRHTMANSPIPASSVSRNPAWAELVQLVPIIVLALPFILAGKVDLSRAAPGFLVGAVLTVPISGAVLARKHLLNPILIGTAVWLWLGVVAFYVPVGSLAAWLTETQAFGIFAAALGVGAVATFVLPTGYIACRSDDPRWTRKASLGLLALTMVVVIWSWTYRHEIRAGGGLPFIVLNVARRVVTLRAPGARTAAHAAVG